MKKIIFPDDVGLFGEPNENSVEFQLKLGDEEFVLENYAKSLEAYQAALKFGGDYPDVYNKIGMIQNLLGRKKEALEAYEEALRLNPNYLDAIVNIGTVYADLGDEENAIASFKRALTLDPNNSEALFNLRLATTKETSAGGFNQIEFMIDIGKSYYDEGMYRQAVEKFKEVLKIKPNYHDVALLLANSYLQEGFYPLALNIYQEILMKKPEWDIVHINLGTLYYNMREYDKAVHSWERALDLNADPDKVKVCIREAQEKMEKGE
jgi:superkiller protein 3